MIKFIINRFFNIMDGKGKGKNNSGQHKKSKQHKGKGGGKRRPRAKPRAVQPSLPNVQKSKFQGMRSQHLRQAEQLIDPGRYPSSVMLPDRSCKPRCTRRFQKTIAMDSSTVATAQGFTVIARPDLDLPFAMTGTGTTIPPVASNYTIKGHFRINTDATERNAGDSYKVVAANNDHIVARAKLDGTIWSLGATSVGGLGADVNLNFNKSSTNYVLEMSFWVKIAGVWTLSYQGTVPETPYTKSFGAATIQDMGFSFTTINVSTDFTFRYTINVGGTAVGQVTSVSGVDLPNSGFATEFKNIAKGGRLTGMSLLCTNTSPDLANGGSIYAARVPRDVPYYTTPAQMQGKCPGFYRGEAAHGAYVWWLPSEETAQTYLDLDEASKQLEQDNYLWVTVSGWGGANVSSVLITITWCVEFFSESQLYEKIVPPVRDPSWDAVQSMLARLPEASCNPDHGKIFRDFVGGAKDAYGRASSHYGENKSFYDNLLRVLMAMAS